MNHHTDLFFHSQALVGLHVTLSTQLKETKSHKSAKQENCYAAGPLSVTDVDRASQHFFANTTPISITMIETRRRPTIVGSMVLCPVGVTSDG